MPKKFIKKVEDFVCDNCGTAVTGTGYTNHCPNCLWSKHVDINPGDRAATCHGLMKPVGIENKGDKMYILQECVKCGHKRRNKRQDNDNFDAILSIYQNSNPSK